MNWTMYAIFCNLLVRIYLMIRLRTTNLKNSIQTKTVLKHTLTFLRKFHQTILGIIIFGKQFKHTLILFLK